MPSQDFIARLLATTALAALFVGAPVAATTGLSGKPQIISAAAHAQEAGDEPNFDDTDFNGGNSSDPGSVDEQDGAFGPSEPFHGDDAEDNTGPVVPRQPIASVTPVLPRSQRGGGDRDNAKTPSQDPVPQAQAVTVSAPPRPTLTPEQQKSSDFAESLDCANKCTVQVFPNGRVAVTIKGRKDYDGTPLTYKLSGTRINIGSADSNGGASYDGYADRSSAEEALRSIIKRF